MNETKRKFYDKEFEMFYDEWTTELSTRKARFIIKKLKQKYNIDFELKFNGRTNGYYAYELKLMKLPKQCNLGILVHEFSHALEYQKYGKTAHKKRMLDLMQNIYKEVKKI